jgi:hypothetical protein
VGLSVTPEVGRAACADSIEEFLVAVDDLGEHELLGASRCHGWTRLDVLVHVLAGWQEMLGGLVSRVDSEPSVDAASYWPAFAADFASEDQLLALMSQRRRTSTYARPAAATDQLHDVAAALVRGVMSSEDRPCLWQGHVFAPGDFLAVWAVENVVHHLDLVAAVPAPPSALALTRATIESLVGESLPASWTDEDAALIGSGRTPVPDDAGPVAARLPALG